MSQTNRQCPICKLDASNVSRTSTLGNGAIYDCQRCGRYDIDALAEMVLASDDTPKPKLVARLRAIKEANGEPPQISSSNWKDLENGTPEYTATEKQNILLRRLAQKTKYPGAKVHLLSHFDYPLAFASCEEEFSYYLRSLIERKLLVLREGSYSDNRVTAEITAAGWDYIEKLATDIEDRTQAFVAMSFSKTMKPMWENAIQPAIEKAGYKAYRVDAEPHISRIDMKIISEIKNSRFLVADVTEQKQGVYFEAGYAIGLGIPVFWSVREKDLPKCHFDTRQYNHIAWKAMDDLRDRLYEFICANIGKRKA